MPSGILEIYSSLDRLEKSEFLDTLEAVSEELNNSLHHFRGIFHSIVAESIPPASLKTKAEKYFSLIEKQFQKLFSSFQDHQAICSTHQDELTQAAPLVLNQDQLSQTGLSTTYQEESPSSNNLANLQQGSTTISSPVCTSHSRTTSLLLYPAEHASDKESDLYNILITELPAPKAKIENIKQIKSKGLAVTLPTSEESKKLIEEISNNASLNSKVSIKFPKKRHPSVIVYNVKNEISLVILTSRFEATRGLFWDGPRNFEPRSDDEDDT
ncbi:hypothetical protein AVEN_239797-1 [Araneus ventricosus]|uniref:Uncharacterized protein n=1 Tax=Araneus ventricosus TaxID=182803 RepID=A0A4Y2EV75_ARAVE|nr:hypothetical protein AVEN_239797-1 [Araneus ventricosus]